MRVVFARLVYPPVEHFDYKASSNTPVEALLRYGRDTKPPRYIIVYFQSFIRSLEALIDFCAMHFSASTLSLTVVITARSTGLLSDDKINQTRTATHFSIFLIGLN